MNTQHIIRAWKDEDYRENLSTSEQKLLPEHPAGYIELYEHELVDIFGASTSPSLSAGCCNSNSDFTCYVCYSVSPLLCAGTYIFNC